MSIEDQSLSSKMRVQADQQLQTETRVKNLKINFVNLHLV